MDFEKELKRLEEISSKMENKTISLDESIALYEEGIKITKSLEEALKEAEKKVEAVIEVK
ncbi:MAG: exodeoxyribonuclease VII small subunit [Bacilli bacterium]|nr:exodeoxyribonuclease VII small subunit [Bacilli bacterium]